MSALFVRALASRQLSRALRTPQLPRALHVMPPPSEEEEKKRKAKDVVDTLTAHSFAGELHRLALLPLSVFPGGVAVSATVRQSRRRKAPNDAGVWLEREER